MSDAHLNPPEPEFEPREIDQFDLVEKAEELLCSRLDKGGLAEMIDEITSTASDMAEFEANLWAYLRENDKALKYICRKYANKYQEDIEEKLQQEHVAEMENLRDNPENI